MAKANGLFALFSGVVIAFLLCCCRFAFTRSQAIIESAHCDDASKGQSSEGQIPIVGSPSTDRSSRVCCVRIIHAVFSLFRQKDQAEELEKKMRRILPAAAFQEVLRGRFDGLDTEMCLKCILALLFHQTKAAAARPSSMVSIFVGFSHVL